MGLEFLRRLVRGNGGLSPDDSHRKLEALCDPDTLRQVEDRHIAIDRALKRSLGPHRVASTASAEPVR